MAGVGFSVHDYLACRSMMRLALCRCWGVFRREQEAEEERARREFEAQMEAVSQLDLLHKEEQSR